MAESNEVPSIPSKMLSADEMWQVAKGSDNWGVEGYEVPRKYFDYAQQKWEKNRAEMIKHPKGQWPPSDWPKDKETDKQLPPKRPNYLDQLYKWTNSYYDPKKAEEVKERLEEQGHPIDKMPEKKKPIDRRKKFLEEEEENNKRKAEMPQIPLFKVDAVKAAKDKIKTFKEKNNKSEVELIKEKYAKFGSLPKCTRITVVSDAEHLGEKYPFYNTFVKEGEEEENEDGKKKKGKKLFYPSKTSTWHKAPVWSYKKKNEEPNEYAQRRDEEHQNRVSEALGEKKFDPIDVRSTFHKVTNKGKFHFQYHKPYDYKGTEQYQTWRENNPGTYPGPQHYWKVLPYSQMKKGKKSKADDEVEQVDGEAKVYLLNRRKTDKRVYKPMKSHIF